MLHANILSVCQDARCSTGYGYIIEPNRLKNINLYLYSISSIFKSGRRNENFNQGEYFIHMDYK